VSRPAQAPEPGPAVAAGQRVLIIGFGNPGRADDGLGPALVARVEAWAPPGVDVESDYQLAIEHAQQVADHDLVIFADADASAGAPFRLRRVRPEPAPSFTSHAVSPGAVLALADRCFGRRPEAWLLGLHAADLRSFREGLSPEGEAALMAAEARLRRILSLR
jgi:hydrogenase maturation protease